MELSTALRIVGALLPIVCAIFFPYVYCALSGLEPYYEKNDWYEGCNMHIVAAEYRARHLREGGDLHD